jgi:hypothetical protein
MGFSFGEKALSSGAGALVSAKEEVAAARSRRKSEAVCVFMVLRLRLAVVKAAGPSANGY